MTNRHCAPQSEARLTKQRNFVRGLVGAAKGRPYEVSQASRAQSLRYGIQAAMLRARAELPVAEYDAYLAWMEEQTDRQAGNLKQLPSGTDHLNGIIDGTPVPFTRELAWVVARLSRAAPEINRFRVLAEALDEAFWSSNNDAVDRLLFEVGSTVGQSFWLMELRIALEQARNGLEAQKKVAEEFKARYRRGLTAYVAHHTSVRNEPSVTPRRFGERMVSRIGGLKRFSETAKSYVRYRLAAMWPSSPAGLAQILQAEQSHPIVDLYETFVHMAQHVVAERSDKHLHAAFRSALDKLSGIRDFRLDKLRLMLGDTRPLARLPKRQTPGRDMLLAGAGRGAVRTLLMELSRFPADPQTLFSAAAALSTDTRLKPRAERAPQAFVVTRLAAVINRGAGMDGAMEELVKFATNFGGLPSARALIGYCAYLCMPESPADFAPLRWASLNCLHLDSMDLLVAAPGSRDATAAALPLGQPGSASLNFHLIAGGFEAVGKCALHPQAEALARGLASARAGDHAEAARFSQQVTRSTGGPAYPAARLLDVHSHLRAGDLGKAIDMMASDIVDETVNSHLMPLDAALGSARWRQVKSHGDRLSLVICLDVLWKQCNRDTVATMRRFAYDEFLLRHGVQRPSELEPASADLPLAQLVYYLYELSVPSVMDMCSVFTGSRDLDLERRAVCALLCTLDRTNAPDYRDEILMITHKMMMEDGLRVVDSSRIHADMDAIKQWAAKELKEGFARYRDLVAAGIGVSDSLDKVLRSILKQENTAKFLDVPENEADDLLVRMVQEVRERFLSDEAHGLDSYLSRRIRHNSMAGYIRGPVEQAELITQRDKATDAYKANEFWLDRLPDLGPAERVNAERLLRKFAQDFDAIISDLKDEAFHVHSAKQPKGIFDVPLSALAIHIVRTSVQEGMHIDGLVDVCLRVFWRLLEPSLQRARTMLTVDATKRAAEAFDRLRAGLAGVAGYSRGFAEMSTAIGDASAGVQRELARVAGWFSRSDNSSVRTEYDLEMVVNIGVESVRAAHRARDPKITMGTLPDLRLTADSLVVVADVIFIALDNVLTHCKISPDPSIAIHSELRRDGQSVAFRVTNPVAPGVRNARAEQELEDIRTAIAGGAYRERLRVEGRSGMYKLASIVTQSEVGRLEFGFDGDGEFFVEVELEVFRPACALEEVADARLAS